MVNAVNFQNDAYATDDVTLGYEPGQVYPPLLLVMDPAAAATVTLPPINAVLPTPPSGNTKVGCGGGYRITISNLSALAITVAAASGDSLNVTGTDILPATGANKSVTFQAVPSLNGASKWIQCGPVG